MLSGVANTVSPVTDYTNWNTLAAAMNCTQSPGKARPACMKAVPGATIRAWLNGPSGLGFGVPIVDKYVNSWNYICPVDLTPHIYTVPPSSRSRTSVFVNGKPPEFLS